MSDLIRYRYGEINLQAKGINFNKFILAGKMTLRRMKKHAKVFDDYDECIGVQIHVCDEKGEPLFKLTKKYKGGRYSSITESSLLKSLSEVTHD